MQKTPNLQRAPNFNIQWDNTESLHVAKQNGTLQTDKTQPVYNGQKGPQNYVTQQTHRTLTSTNDVTPLTALDNQYDNTTLSGKLRSAAGLLGAQANSTYTGPPLPGY